MGNWDPLSKCFLNLCHHLGRTNRQLGFGAPEWVSSSSFPFLSFLAWKIPLESTTRKKGDPLFSINPPGSVPSQKLKGVPRSVPICWPSTVAVALEPRRFVYPSCMARHNLLGMAMGHNLCLHFGADERPCTTDFFMSPGVQGLDPQPHCLLLNKQYRWCPLKPRFWRFPKRENGGSPVESSCPPHLKHSVGMLKHTSATSSWWLFTLAAPGLQLQFQTTSPNHQLLVGVA